MKFLPMFLFVLLLIDIAFMGYESSQVYENLPKYGETVCNDSGRQAIVLNKIDAIIQTELLVKYKDDNSQEQKGYGYFHRCS